MRIARLLVLGLTLLEILHVALAMQPGQPTGPRAGGSCTQPESFEGWTAPYRTAPEHGAWGRRPAHWAVTITRAGPHDLVSLPGPSHLLSLSSPSGACEAWEPTQTYFISDEGTTSWVWLTGGGSHGGGTEIGAEPFRHFKLLMAHLPPGLHRLPPPSRRLVTQVVEASGVAVRVYDQAQLPNDILELLRLLGADTWPVTDYPQFQPEKRCTAAAFATAGSPASLETTDPSQLHRAVLATGLHHHLIVTETIPSMGPTTVIAEDARAPRQAPYDPGLQSVLRIETAPARGDAGAVLHEFRTPMNGRTWIRTYAARFTPDGRYLLTMNNAPGVQFYDTATWQPVAHIAGIPDRLLAYYPSADWARALPCSQPARSLSSTERRTAESPLSIQALRWFQQFSPRTTRKLRC